MMTTGESLALVTTESINHAIQRYRAKTGRPTTYSDDTAATIIERLSGGETLTSICKDPAMPSFPTVWDWGNNCPSFANAIASARRIQATAYVEEGKAIIDAADDQNGMAPVQKADKQALYRFRLAQAQDRDTYGDKIQQDINVKGVVVTTNSERLKRLVDGCLPPDVIEAETV